MAKYYKLQSMGGGVAAYTVEDVEPQNGEDFKLEELQAYVGGLIEIVYLNDELIMVLNEEGMLHNLPVNPLATAIFQEHTGRADYILGNVLVCGNDEVR